MDNAATHSRLSVWLILFALFLLPTSSFAQSQRNPCFNVGTTQNQQNCNPVGLDAGLPVQTNRYQSTGVGQYGVNINTVQTLTVPAGTTVAEICVETQAARYTDDNLTTPTATVGIPVLANTCFQYAGAMSQFKIIAQAAGATMDVSYYK